MEIRTMTNEELEIRIAEIETAMTAEDADLDALAAEMTEIEARKAELATAEAARQAEARKIAEGTIPGKVIEEKKENKPMSNMEIRNSAEYVRAFANYVRTGNDTECRALLTENVGRAPVGSTMLPVPEFVETIIHTAWEESPILSRVTKSYIKGNLKVGFEVSASNAEIHTEGTDPIEEETLMVGIARLVPQTVKKWISVSDEVLDLDDGAFLRYVYSEIAHKIADKLTEMVITALKGQTPAGTPSVPANYVINADPTTARIIEAAGHLSDEARNPVLLMDKATQAALKTAALNGQYAYDPFDGYEVLTHSSLAGDVILVDLGSVQVNFPNGEDVQFKFDDLTLATSDLVRIIGRLPVAVAVVKPNQSVYIDYDDAESGS